MNQRLREFDHIRACAALSVIAIHVTAGFAQNSLFGFVWNQAMRYAVPLFVILSGFLLYYADLRRPRMSYFQYLTKRGQKIFVPYLLWTLFYTVYSNRHDVLEGDGFTPLMMFGKHILMGTGYVHLYFVLIVLQLYILYPLLRKWLESNPMSAVFVSLGLTLSAQTMIYLHQLGVFVLPSIGMPYVSLFPIWLFYFVFGMYAASQKENWQARLTGREFVWGLAWIASLVLLAADSRYTQTGTSSIKPTVMVYCMISFFFLYTLALRGKQTMQRWGDWLDWLSTHSFLIFLLHPLLLNLLAVHVPKWPALSRLWSGIDGMILLFLATTACTIALTRLLSFSPLAGWIGGVYTGKRKQNHVTVSG